MNINGTKINPISYKTVRLKNKNHHFAKVVTDNNATMSFLSTLSVQKQAEINSKKHEENLFFEDFLTKKSKVTLDEYKEIAKNHPVALLKAKEYCNLFYDGKTTPISLAKTALLINKYLNENYENFRIISVGTSPSALLEQLEALGQEVIYIPVSGLNSFDMEYDRVEENEELSLMLDYVKSKNVNDDKKNIVIDYTITGYTLKILCDLIKKYCSIENVEQISLKKLINKASKDGKNIFSRQKTDYSYIQDAWWGIVEEISSTPHFPVVSKVKSLYEDIKNSIFIENKSKKEVFENFENGATPLSRAFALCTMAEIDKLLSVNGGDNEN